jgi:hypothetical protein
MRSPGGSGAASIFEWQTPVVRARQAMAGQIALQVWQPASVHFVRMAASSTVEVTHILQPAHRRPVVAVIWHCSLRVGLQLRARASAAWYSVSYVWQTPAQGSEERSALDPVSTMVTASTGVKVMSRGRSRPRSGLTSAGSTEASAAGPPASGTTAASGSFPPPKAPPPPPRVPGGPPPCPLAGTAPSPIVAAPLFSPQARASKATTSRHRAGKAMDDHFTPFGAPLGRNARARRRGACRLTAVAGRASPDRPAAAPPRAPRPPGPRG